MGRKPETGGWHILVDKQSNALRAYNPEAQPGVKKELSKRYEDIGILNSKEDAENFMEFLELGILPDAVAFLDCEHRVKEALRENEDAIPEDIAQELCEQAHKVQLETGRTCFGNCKSLESAKACRTCFTARKETWNLCAYVKCVLSEYNMTFPRREEA